MEVDQTGAAPAYNDVKTLLITESWPTYKLLRFED